MLTTVQAFIQWLEDSKIEMKIKSNYDSMTFNLLFIYWDYSNTRHLLEFNLSWFDIVSWLKDVKKLKSKLQFIEFKLKGTL